MRPSLSLIIGQTASGKTARAVEEARRENGALINCDSRQVYTSLDIITGKTDNPEDIPMHAVDLCDPHTYFSAANYATAARAALAHIMSEGKRPIVVGGTGMYARFFLHGVPSLMNHSYPDRAPESTTSVADLVQRIGSLDPSALNTLNTSDRANPRRLTALIQRLTRTEESVSPLSMESPDTIANQFDVQTTILIHRSPALLDKRLRSRIQERITAGALDECRSLMERGYTLDDPGLHTIGYRSVFAHIAGTLSLEAMIEEWFYEERHYAKRQKTYFLKYFPSATIVEV